MSKRSADQMSGNDLEAQRTRAGQKRATRKATRAPPLYKARVTETPDSSTIRVASSVADIDDNVLARIKKCLDRAYHANAAEAEAKAALHIASRLMNQYNVSQAEVLAHEPPEVQRQYGGSSCVSITRCHGDRTQAVQQNAFVFPLCDAILTYFNTKSYTSHRRSSLMVVFYGVAQNTATAAHSFEMVFNLMLEWARPYAGRNGKNSYCIGVSNGLLRDANEEKIKEEADAKKAEENAIAARIKQEEAERQAELSRLADFPEDTEQDPKQMDVPVAVDLTEADDDNSSTTSSVSWCPSWASNRSEDDVLDQHDLDQEEDVDDEDDEDDGTNAEADFNDIFIDLTGDDNADIANLVSTFVPRADKAQHPPPRETATASFHDAPEKATDSVKPTSTLEEEAEESKWKSHSQLILFRDTAKKIADDYAKDHDLKFRSKKARKFDMDRNAYKHGQQDSKKINVREKTIKDTAAQEAKVCPSHVFTD